MDKTVSQAQVGTPETPCGIAEKSMFANQPRCQCPKSVISPSDSSLSMPVCFLVREQAKSLIAIQDLQKRLENIEGFQSEVISAIGEVHNYLSHDIREGGLVHSSGNSLKKKSAVIHERSYFPNAAKQNELQLPYRKAQGDTKESISCSMPATTKQEATPGRPNLYRPKNGEISAKKIFELSKTKDSAPESDKQDSGLDSDCREQGQEISISQNAVIFSPRKNSTGHFNDESGDELLELLNEIGRKGEALQKRVALSEEKSNTVSSNQMNEKSKIQNQHQYQEFSQILSEVKEQVDIRNKLCQNGSMEPITRTKEEGSHPGLAKQHEFDNNLPKSQTIRNNKAYQRDDLLATTVCSVQQDMVESANEKSVHKVNGAKVSSILKESSVLELRKQVLLYLMENEILHTKLFQTEQQLGTKSDQWQKAETFLNVEVKNLMQENQDLHITIEEQKLEVIALKSKVRMLERVLQAVTVENRELNFQLGETLGFGDALQNGGQPLKKSFSNNTMSLSEAAKPRRSSLPAKLCSQQDTSMACNKPQALNSARSSNDVAVCGQLCTHEIFQGSSTKQKMILVNQACQSSTQSHLSPNPLIRHSSPFATTRHSDCLDELIKRTLNSELLPAKSCEVQRKGKEPNLSQSQTAYNEHINESSLKPSIKRTISDNVCKPLEPIKEKSRSSTESAKFPFYSILEKLKPSADYKLRKNLRPELSQISESEISTNQAPKNTKLSSSNQKISEQRYNRNQGKTSSSVESDQSLLEECKRMYPGQDKNFHKRMQDFLDRITAESDEAMV